MTDRPIIFSAPMVQALLAGRKTQTRRLLRSPMPPAPGHDNIHPANLSKTLHPSPYFDAYCGGPRTPANPRGMTERWCWWTRDDRQGLPTVRVGYVPGDRMWVREAWTTRQGLDATAPRDISPAQSIGYLADTDEGPWLGKARPSIHMPRWASRLTLIVTDVRVQRLKEISEDDAQAEGVAPFVFVGQTIADPYRFNFQLLWAELHGPNAWNANPPVVALTFTAEQRNIDA